MFDTMTITKITSGLLGAFLALLLIKWGAEIVYGTGHGGGDHEQAYVIDTGEPDDHGEAEPVVVEVSFADLYAAADASEGERLWNQCRACHKLDGTDGTGPHLNGVVDRQKAAVAGFSYSEGLAAQSDETWSPENLSAFLENPRGAVPGTKMTYNGMRDPADRANLIAYLAAAGG